MPHDPSLAAVAAGPCVALDLGSSRVRAGLPGRPVLVDRPSSFGPDRRPGAGPAARPAPIRHGLVDDVNACAGLARGALHEMVDDRAPGLILLGVPTAAGDAHLRRVLAAVHAAAPVPVCTVDAPLAAALGGGINATDPRPRVIMDIGAGIVEMAVVAHGSTRTTRSIQYVPEYSPGRAAARLPSYVVDRLAIDLRRMLDSLPAPSRMRARDGGLLLTGGGSLLPSLPGRLTARVRLSVTVARDPAHATIRGLVHLCAASPAVRERAAVTVHRPGRPLTA